MKIKKLLLSVCMVCLALLVFGGATVPAMQFSAQALVVRAASDYSTLEPKELFNKKGNYTVDMDYLKSSLANGQVFSFFGYEWRVVFINETENVATFWMKDPYTKATFDRTTASGHGLFVEEDGDTNIWANGYSGTIWKSQKGDVLIEQSQIREFLFEEADRIINKKAYAKYKNKVVAGAVNGTNETVTEKQIAKLAFSETSIEHYTKQALVTNELTAKYGLDKDRLWLPSLIELTTMWNVHENILQWGKTTNGDRAWLRTPDIEESQDAVFVRSIVAEEDKTGKIDDFFGTEITEREYGVRPAIHLNISELTESGSANGWFNEDWLKTLFIVVCVLGIVGIVLVITAVVLKSRQKQAK